MDFKAAIFDLDGTLFDSMWVWKKIDMDFLAKRGIIVPPDYMLAVAHLGAYQTAVYTAERFGFSDTPEELIAEWTEMAIEFYRNKVGLKDGAYEYLGYLYNNGIKLAVATANDKALYEPALKHTGIDKFFSAVVNVDEVERKKGFPDIYWLAAEKLGVQPEESVVFEDIYLGIKGAKDGGFKAVCVYDETSADDRGKIEELADLYIEDYRSPKLFPKELKSFFNIIR